MDSVPDVEERILSLFQPDSLLDFEYHEALRRKLPLQPERSLMLAVLEDAVVCFQKHLLARNKCGKELFREAEDWLLEEQSGRMFSFHSVCGFLGLDPEWMRRELTAWKQHTVEKQRKQKVVSFAAAAAGRDASWPEARRSA